MRTDGLHRELAEICWEGGRLTAAIYRTYSLSTACLWLFQSKSLARSRANASIMARCFRRRATASTSVRCPLLLSTPQLTRFHLTSVT